MKKRILCLAMMAMMVLGIPMTANAEEFEGSKDWAVTYTDGKLNSNFKGSEASDEVLENLQPGDTIHLQVRMQNKSSNKSDWYMKNEVIESLEDNSTAAGGAYTYILTYVNPAGKETVIYSNERVGGETETSEEEESEIGLHQATNSLDKEYFYLDRLDVNQSASVYLTIKLDGVTQGNDYQKTLAKLQMDFAVEKVNEVTITKVKTIRRQLVTAVQTGDTAPVVLFSAAALLSGITLFVIAVKQMKNRNQKGEQ